MAFASAALFIFVEPAGGTPSSLAPEHILLSSHDGIRRQAACTQPRLVTSPSLDFDESSSYRVFARLREASRPHAA